MPEHDLGPNTAKPLDLFVEAFAVVNVASMSRLMDEDGERSGSERLLPEAAAFKGWQKGAKVLTLPILPPLRINLDASELGKDIWLETAFGKPYRVAGFGNAFRVWCKEAGLSQCKPHGLRKIGAVRAAEAGASEHELMAMFGWDDANMARIYTRKAAQKRLAASGAAKLRIVPPIVPPNKNVIENNEIERYWRPVGESNSCFSRERAAS
jgi:Phage integrase family